jgi:hypothetical protein
MDPEFDPGFPDISPAVMLVFGLFGAAMGFACGKIPMAYANERRRDGLGLASMVTCVLCGFLGGCLLALPMAMVWTLIIICVGPAPDGRPTRREYYKPWEPPVMGSGPALPGPYTEIGPVLVCNECQHAHKKGPEGVPPACPSCGYEFKTQAAEIPVVEAAVARSEPSTPEPRRKLVSWREERRRGNVTRGERALSARRKVALAREGAVAPPPRTDSDEVVELRPPSDDPRGW